MTPYRFYCRTAAATVAVVFLVPPVSVAGQVVEGDASPSRSRDRPPSGHSPPLACDPDSDPETLARLWDGVTASLARADREAGDVEFAVVSWQRRLDPRSLKVREETRQTRTGASPGGLYVALPPERLSRDGYVVETGDGWAYYGPGLTTFLSEEFLDDHCFRVAKSGRGEVELRFEPVEERGVIDIEGSMTFDHLDPGSIRVEFRYAGLPRALRHDALGGELEFERLQGGTWIVRRWRLRTPLYGVPAEDPIEHLRTDASRRRVRVLEIWETGAEVERVPG